MVILCDLGANLGPTWWSGQWVAAPRGVQKCAMCVSPLPECPAQGAAVHLWTVSLPKGTTDWPSDSMDLVYTHAVHLFGSVYHSPLWKIQADILVHYEFKIQAGQRHFIGLGLELASFSLLLTWILFVLRKRKLDVKCVSLASFAWVANCELTNNKCKLS